MAKKEHTLFDKFQYNGYWWMPEKAENKLPGLLRYEAGDISLELLGSASQLLGVEHMQFPHMTPLLLGHLLERNEDCTIYDALEIKRLHISSGHVQSTYSGKYVFLGTQLSTESEMRFSSVAVRYANLEQWMFEQAFLTQNWQVEDKKLRGLDASWKFTDPFEVLVPALDATIGLIYSPHWGGDLRSHTWEQEAFLTIRPTTSQNLAWYMQAQIGCQNLFTLFMGEPAYPRLIAITKATSDTADNAKSNVYYQHKYKEMADLSFMDMLVRFTNVKDRLGFVLPHWFDRTHTLRNVYNLFFSSFYGDLYVESHFLSLMQAVESFCRAAHPGKFVSDEQYRKIEEALRAAIPSDTPPDLKQSLQDGKIKFGNELSLTKRLKDVLSSIESETQQLICQQPNYFAKRIVKTRNYLTHYTDELDAEALHDDDLFYANLRLRTLMTVLLLKEIGFEETFIRKALGENTKYQQLIQLYRGHDSM